MNPWLDRQGYDGFVVLNTNYLILAARRDQLLGMNEPVEEFLSAFAGESKVTEPFQSLAMLPDAKGKFRAGVPTMFAVAPIKSADGRVIAVLGLRIAPEKDFTRILATARPARPARRMRSRATDCLLSNSRFDDELRRFGLIPDSADADPILNLELRDPLVDLSKGKASPKRRSEQPLTLPVREAGAGHSGVNVDGYRDYRGVPVVGAWEWLPEFNFGLVTEMDESEAFRPLHIMRMGFGFIFALLVAGSVAIYFLMRMANRLAGRSAQGGVEGEAARPIRARRQDRRGRVRLGISRPPCADAAAGAVKLLESDTADENTMARFEQEVQMTSQLTHPEHHRAL